MTTTAPTLFDAGLPAAARNATTTRRDAPQTSRQAARLAFPRSGTRRAAVLTYLGRRGLAGATDHEIAAALGMPLSSVCARRNELVRDGWLVDSGNRRVSQYGAKGIVWVLSDAGKREWAA